MKRNERVAAMRVRMRGYTVTLGAAAVLAAGGLGLVRQHQLHNMLAAEARDLDSTIVRTMQRWNAAQSENASRRSAASLKQKVEEMGLGLTPVHPSQRIELSRSVPVMRPMPLVRPVARPVPAPLAPATLPASAAPGSESSPPGRRSWETSPRVQETPARRVMETFPAVASRDRVLGAVRVAGR